jgi:hypothetical protein
LSGNTTPLTMHTLLFLGSYIYRETVMPMTTRAYAVVF